MSRRPNPEEEPALPETPSELLMRRERGRDRLLIGLSAIGAAILVGSCYAKEAGVLMINDYNATILGTALVGAGVLGTLTRRRYRQ